jgi:hypothetical protein
MVFAVWHESSAALNNLSEDFESDAERQEDGD